MTVSVDNEPDKVIYLSIASFTIAIVLYPVEITFFQKKFYKDTQSSLRGFILKQKPSTIDYFIHVREKKYFSLMQKKQNRKYYIDFFHRKKGKNIITYYWISVFQLELILRDILLELLRKKGGFILHGSAVNYHGRALIFTGNSGDGKSTAMSLLRQLYPSLADDKIIIRRINNKYYLYQTPFSEKFTWISKNNQMFEVNKIFFLKKSKQFSIKKKHKNNLLIAKLYKQLLTDEKYIHTHMKNLMRFTYSFDNFFILSFSKSQTRMARFMKNL